MNTNTTTRNRRARWAAVLTAGLVFILASPGASASDKGDIKGRVLDETGAPAMGANVLLRSGEHKIAAQTPDAQGEYYFKEVTPGAYDIEITMVGYKKKKITGIKVIANKTFYVQDVKLVEDITQLGDIEIEPAQESMAQQTMSSGTSIDEMEFKQMAAAKGDLVGIVVNLTPGTIPTDDGKDMYVRGARSGSTEYIIDGEKVIGSFNVPSQSVQNVTVYTGGIPAMYGDLTGGLVVVSTKSYFSGIMAKRNWYAEYYEKQQQEQQKEEEDAQDQQNTNNDLEQPK
ncbi:MAG: TonB-dependent receptor [Bacteroidota bacterium]